MLEVGAGSGYAAAVLSRIASKVYAIERHEVLANQARERLEALGYTNAKIIFADGTKGLPGRRPRSTPSWSRPAVRKCRRR